jgi:2'-5' RNA ligase
VAALRRDMPERTPQRGHDTVTAVLCAAFDEATDAAVFTVREVVRAAGIRLPERPPHRPHFSLAAARVARGAELDEVIAVGREVAARHVPIEFSLANVGRFGRAGVIWLGPATLPAALRALQRDADMALQDAGWDRAFGDRSAPGQWVAHCTLATRVPKPQLRAVQESVRASYRPIDARIDALAVILVGGRGDTAHLPLGRQAG